MLAEPLAVLDIVLSSVILLACESTLPKYYMTSKTYLAGEGGVTVICPNL